MRIKKTLAIATGLGSLLVSFPVVAQPEREGFTMELGLGLAWTMYEEVWYQSSAGPGGYSEQVIRERASRIGLAPLSLSLGGFLSRDFALMARMAGTSYFMDDVQYLNSFYGVVGQYWLSDRFFVGGGPGLALHGPNAFFGRSNVEPVAGFGLNARFGAIIWSNENHGFAGVFELFPSWYEDTSVYGAALNLQWQLF